MEKNGEGNMEGVEGNTGVEKKINFLRQERLAELRGLLEANSVYLDYPEGWEKDRAEEDKKFFEDEIEKLEQASQGEAREIIKKVLVEKIVRQEKRLAYLRSEISPEEFKLQDMKKILSEIG
jgi:hypothetical protein